MGEAWSLLGDFFRWVVAVMIQWTVLVGGLVSVAILVFEKVSGTSLSWKPSVAVFSVTLVVASFLAWRELYVRATLVPVVDGLAIWAPDPAAEKQAMWAAIPVSVTNLGPPTIARCGAFILVDGKEVVAEGVSLDRAVVFAGPGGGTVTVKPENLITRAPSTTPIVTNGRAVGYYVGRWWIPQNVVTPYIHSLRVFCFDAQGRRHTSTADINFDMSGKVTVPPGL